MQPGSPFLLGVNYWPRKKGMFMWQQFDPAEIREEFTMIVALPGRPPLMAWIRETSTECDRRSASIAWLVGSSPTRPIIAVAPASQINASQAVQLNSTACDPGGGK